MVYYVRQKDTFNFWSNSMGWVDLDDATRFERPEGFIPVAGEWFPLSEEMHPIVRFLSVMYFEGHENQTQAICQLLVQLRLLCDRVEADYFAIEKCSYPLYLEAKQQAEPIPEEL